jgi:hypothetical protein
MLIVVFVGFLTYWAPWKTQSFKTLLMTRLVQWFPGCSYSNNFTSKYEQSFRFRNTTFNFTRFRLFLVSSDLHDCRLSDYQASQVCRLSGFAIFITSGFQVVRFCRLSGFAIHQAFSDYQVFRILSGFRNSHTLWV